MEYKILLFDVLNSTMCIIKEKCPSKLLPFKGNFPLVDPGHELLFDAGCEGKTYLEECPDWIQQILIKAQRIKDIEEGFFQYLKLNGLDAKYYTMSEAEKAVVIKSFFDSTSLDENDLIIDDGYYSKI